MVDNNKTKSLKLRTTFHRTFWLSRELLRLLLATVEREGATWEATGKRPTQKMVYQSSGLGTVQAEAMPRYALACGLLDERLRFTALGDTVFKQDPLLATATTQWLLHYHISTKHGLGPFFWSQLVTDLFRVDSEFDAPQVSQIISRVVAESEGRKLKERDARATATIFLNTYTSPDALGALGILKALGQDRYRVLDPVPPSPWVFALALLDYWRATYGENRLTINLDDLSAPDALGDIFLIGRERINRYLARLQDEGLVEVYRYAPPYQVILRHSDPAPLLEKLYAPDNSEPG